MHALPYHFIPDGKGGTARDVAGVRYIDRYRKDNDRWRFAKRVVVFDFRDVKPVLAPAGTAPVPLEDPSYATLVSRLFARGPRP